MQCVIGAPLLAGIGVSKSLWYIGILAHFSIEISDGGPSDSLKEVAAGDVGVGEAAGSCKKGGAEASEVAEDEDGVGEVLGVGRGIGVCVCVCV